MGIATANPGGKEHRDRGDIGLANAADGHAANLLDLGAADRLSIRDDRQRLERRTGEPRRTRRELRPFDRLGVLGARQDLPAACQPRTGGGDITPQVDQNPAAGGGIDPLRASVRGDRFRGSSEIEHDAFGKRDRAHRRVEHDACAPGCG